MALLQWAAGTGSTGTPIRRRLRLLLREMTPMSSRRGGIGELGPRCPSRPGQDGWTYPIHEVEGFRRCGTTIEVAETVVETSKRRSVRRARGTAVTWAPRRGWKGMESPVDNRCLTSGTCFLTQSDTGNATKGGAYDIRRSRRDLDDDEPWGGPVVATSSPCRLRMCPVEYRQVPSGNVAFGACRGRLVACRIDHLSSVTQWRDRGEPLQQTPRVDSPVEFFEDGDGRSPVEEWMDSI